MLSDFKVYAVLPTKDLEKARQWYLEKTRTSPSAEDPGGLWYECAEGTWFVVTPSEFAGTAENTAVSFQVSGIEEVMSRMREAGVTFEDYDMPEFETVDGLMSSGPYKAAWFKDADGNIIELSDVGS